MIQAGNGTSMTATEKRNFALDNTLRYLYITLRNKRKPLMAIEFRHNGRLWRADTPEEAIALRERLEAHDRSELHDGADPSGFDSDIWTPDLTVELLEGLGQRQKEFLKLLYKRQEVTSTEAANHLKLASEVSLAGVLSGLSKQAKRLEMKPWQLYLTTVEWDGKEKTRTFKLSNAFRTAAGEIGWPETWI